MPYVGQRAPKKKMGRLEFCKNHQWQSLGNICVIAGEGWSELSFIIDDFSVISLIKADIFSLFHRGAFPEKAVSTLILSFSTFLGCRVICIY